MVYSAFILAALAIVILLWLLTQARQQIPKCQHDWKISHLGSFTRYTPGVFDYGEDKVNKYERLCSKCGTHQSYYV